MTDSNESLADADRENGADEPDESTVDVLSSDEPETGESETDSLPPDVVDEAERLTRLERKIPDETETQAYAERRETLLEEHEFTARIRTDDDDDVLVLHPEEWHDAESDVIRPERIDDIDRAVEVRLEGTGDPDDWEDVEADNRDLVERVRNRHGEVHGENARLLADFVGNHYAKRIEDVTSEELTEFRSDYFVRNAWPSDDQQDVIEESIRLVYETADEPVPELQGR